MDYEDPVKMVQDIHQHVLDLGHQVAPADDPSRQLMGYVCMHCEADLFWHCTARSLKALSSRSIEADLIRQALSSHVRREGLTQYLNNKTFNASSKRLSRYERPWVI
jgi:hypothetical protein